MGAAAGTSSAIGGRGQVHSSAVAILSTGSCPTDLNPAYNASSCPQANVGLGWGEERRVFLDGPSPGALQPPRIEEDQALSGELTCLRAAAISEWREQWWTEPGDWCVWVEVVCIHSCLC